MKNYKGILLNKLVDSYENSTIYRGETQRDNKVYFKFNSKNIKEYYDEQNFKYKEEIDIACKQLENHEFIKIYRGKGLQNHIIERLQLNLDKIAEIYLYLNRKEKKEKNNEVLLILTNFENREDLLGEFSRYIILKLKDNQSVKKYLDIENILECKDILKGIEEVLKAKQEIFRRNFSVKIFGDSKRYEAIEGKVIKIIKEFSKDDYVNDYNILKNYTYVYFKGNIELKFKDSYIAAKDFIGGVAISSKDIDNIETISIRSSKLITIENLTTFNNYNEEGAVIYLGGYHNTVRQKLLIKIYSQNPDVKYYHFGDIDAGGFKILAHLKRKTKIPFIPFKMDVNTLSKYIDYAKDLTVNDVTEIKRILDDKEYKEYSEVLVRMLELKKKLEQEIII